MKIGNQVPHCVNPRDLHDLPEYSVSKSNEGALIIGIESMASSSGLGEDGENDDPMVGVGSTVSSTSLAKSNEGAPIICVESTESSSGLGEDGEEDDPMIGVGSKESSKSLANNGENDDPTIVIASKELMSNAIDDGGGGGPMIGVEAMEPFSNPFADDEGDPKTGVDLNKSSDSLSGEADPVNDIPVVNPVADMESNEMVLDTDLSDNLAATSEPRRSSRNAGVKSGPHLKIATPSKLSRGKRKLAHENGAVLLQVSASNNNSIQQRELNMCYLV